MTSDSPLVPAPASLLAEVTPLLEYGLTKNCETSAALHSTLQQLGSTYDGRPAVPVPLELLTRLHRSLLVLCISAGADFAPGEKVVRFTRAAERVRVLIPPTPAHPVAVSDV
ncbi:hypothetical protein [Streptomyces sp. NPDC088785]|uniref:hypothetical protein n=1 Tax=Streptomyces sp. NPDC088785 TaxID=3365897 RepID=UPI0038159DD3